MKIRANILIIIATTMLISSCATNNSSYMKLLMHEGEVTTKINVQEQVDYKLIKTFSVIPMPFDNEWNNADVKKYDMILFKLKSEMEVIGYRFVDSATIPDITVTALVTNRIVQTDIPSYTFNMPVYNQPTNVTSNVYSSGKFNAYSNDSRGWGTYSGNSTITTEVPGYYSNQEIVVPGETLTSILPVVKVAVYDKKKRLIWLASSVGETKVKDLSISTQFLIRGILKKFPMAEDAKLDYQSQDAGYAVGTYTVDGNNFYPIVVYLYKKSPAENAGMKDFDIITKINGISVANISEKKLKTSPEYNFRNDNTLAVTVFRDGSLTELVVKK